MFSIGFIAIIDYTPATGNLTFEAGVLEPQCADVGIVNDTILENQEIFFVVISTSDSGVMVATNMTTVFILDNDGKQY